MAGSVEHDYLAQELGRQIEGLARTRLFGITEADRRTFDLACRTFRDFERPLVSQVLWKHEEGVDKDLRILLHDAQSSLKLYLVRDSVRARARIDEVLGSYRSSRDLRRLLRGLRLIFLPPDLDADSEQQRAWVAGFLRRALTTDLLFAVLFGGLSRFEFAAFLYHHGPVGLKFAILHEVTENGIYHMPTFKSRLKYSTNGPIREALVLLATTGLIRNVPDTDIYLTTVRGRLLMDLFRALIEQAQSSQNGWSDEIRQLLLHLGHDHLPACELPLRVDDLVISDPIALNLFYASAGLARFGRALMDAETSRRFYGPFDWQHFAKPEGYPGADYTKWMNDEEALLFVEPGP